MARAAPVGNVRVVAGGSSTALICRFGATDWIEVRRDVTEADPEGRYDLARLPREAVSTPVDRATLGMGETPEWDDFFLPPVGTPLLARPEANAGPARGFLAIDASSIRPNA